MAARRSIARRLLRGGAPAGGRPGAPGAGRGAAADLHRLVGGETRALAQHRASPLPTVLLLPSLREGGDVPDDLLRFQIVTKMPYGDLGDPWTAARRDRDPRWYALETAKALVQTYGRGCRHAEDYGVTYVLDRQCRCCRGGSWRQRMRR